MNTLAAGMAAPLFSLKNQNEDLINLADHIGKNKVLVYFYS